LYPDSGITSEFYLQGVVNGVAGFIKFNRNNANVQWYATFKYLSVTSSYTEVTDNYNIVGCGWYTSDSVIYSAGIYRIGNDGTFKWFYSLDP
jgi:hypothetical protein